MQDCISIEYSTQMSSGRLTLHSESAIAYAIDPCTDMNQMASLHFFFPSLSYTVIVNQPESLLKWLSILRFYYKTFYNSFRNNIKK